PPHTYSSQLVFYVRIAIPTLATAHADRFNPVSDRVCRTESPGTPSPQCLPPSSRRSPIPASCSPALRITWVGFLGSVTSFSARPLYSLASSSGLGLFATAYGQ